MTPSKPVEGPAKIKGKASKPAGGPARIKGKASKPAGRPVRVKSKVSAPARPLTRSPLRTEQEPSFGPGHCVVLYLHSPREKHWGTLLSMDAAGLWLRGIELESFDAWAREQASREPGHMGVTTFFVPYLRVDKVTLDERVGLVPSLTERFEAITGRPVEAVLGGEG